MPLAQTIQDQVLSQYNRQRYEIVMGQIESYDSDSNRAHVYIVDPKNGEEVKLYNVPVEMSGVGVTTAGPFSGDQVYVAFANGSLIRPKVIGRADETFYYYTRSLTKHERKGAYLSEVISDLTSFGGEEPTGSATSSSSTWIDVGNSSVATYLDYTGDAISVLQSEISSAPYYALAEIGLTHPLNSSTFKIRDNGNIDAFVGTNCGIRISPASQTILLLSSAENHHAGYESHVVDGKFSIEASQNVQRATSTLFKSDTTTIDSSTNLLLNTSSLVTHTTNNLLTYESMRETGSSYSQTVKRFEGAYNTYTNEVSGVATMKAATLSVSGTDHLDFKGTKTTLESDSLAINSVSSVQVETPLASLKGNQFKVESMNIDLKAPSIALKGTSLDLNSAHLNVGNGGIIQFNGAFTGDFEREVKKAMEKSFGALFTQHHNNANHDKWMKG